MAKLFWGISPLPRELRPSRECREGRGVFGGTSLQPDLKPKRTCKDFNGKRFFFF